MIHMKVDGDFSKTKHFMRRSLQASKIPRIEVYAEKGLQALREATPVDTGLTSNSWSYEISRSADRTKITYSNNNINKNVNIAIILQYGHGTGTGGWVEGRDYINPAARPVFDEIVKNTWEEVTRT